MKKSIWAGLVVGIIIVVVSAARLPGQSLFATLTGVVSDTSGAVVPGASVKLINEQSGNTYVTRTDAAGYYTFAEVSVGNFTYKLTVEKKGFEVYTAPGLSLLGGQKRNVNVTLKIGSTTQTVEVSGVATSIVPVDSGEKSEALTSQQLQTLVQIGSNAAEYLKIMPAFAISNGTTNKQNYDGEIIGINANGNGSTSSQSPLNNAYSYDGEPANSADIMADGAHVSDPGCDCDTPVNPNSDFISELKVSTTDFSAETQKGPVVITTVTKAGTSQFHGSAFFYARNYVLNANDAQFNASGQSRPTEDYYYPGFSFGGPVVIPGTSFNKKRDKLFFFTGFEYFHQTLDTGLLRATVPTSSIMNGDFSTSSLEQLGDANAGYITASGAPPGVNCGTSGSYTPCLNAATLAKFPGGQIPTGDFSPNMLALMKLYPAANANPNTTGGYNYVQSEIFGQPDEQWDTRVDYNISDSTKLFVRYNLQRETQQFPVGLWWTNGSQVPYPTPILGENRSDSVSTSLTHIFSPTLTNEFVFGYTYIGFPNVFQDPSKVNRANVGYKIPGLFKNGVAQIPSFGSFGGETALIFNPSGFEAGGASAGLYADKWIPSLSDTIAKVIGTHTLKAGFYWEWIRNSQPASESANGEIQFGSSGNINTTGDSYADELLGIPNSYNETNFDRINDIAYNDYEGFAQDDWKVTRNMTLNYGLRLTHFQPWYDRLNDGYAIFVPSQYNGQACTVAPAFCGFEWHKKDPSVPDSGFPSRALFYQPRLGFAYDLGGSGKTVLRGGWGRYYFHAGQFTNGLDATAGVESVSLGTTVPLPGGVTQPLLVDPSPLFPGAAGLATVPYTAVASAPFAVDSTDDKEPYTDNWNFTVSRQLPWSSLLEVAYVGNRTRDIPSGGNGGSLGLGNSTLNINLVPKGAMWASKNGGVDPNKLIADNFRPYLGYSNLYVATSNAYSNYNSLQVSWLRTRGRYSVDLNYTYEKALGILTTGGSTLIDQFNLADNYGVLASNRTHVFNAAYSIQLPSPAHERLAAGVINGWQLSGITSIQSGANLSAYQNQNFNMNLNSATIPGTTFDISNVSILGTPNIQLNPLQTCNPRANLGPHEFVNGNCFAMPTAVGENGPTVMPPIYGPAYFDSDLGLFKTFKITESKSLQFRVDGYNFLNHPLWSFPSGQNLGLSFDASTGKSNNPDFGVAPVKQGHRIIELAVKFFF
jgi:hypothetical protein